MDPLKIGTILQDKYEVVDVLGRAESTAVYVASETSVQERFLLWESGELFKLTGKPPGAVEYFQQDGKHYLVLYPQGQTLAFVLTMAGRLEELPAGLWMLQICRAMGYWHTREDQPLISLRQGPLSLADFRLSDVDTVLISAYGDRGRAAAARQGQEAEGFGAPETEAADLSPRSDVYALGAMLYCLLTGTPPPPPEARQARRARPPSPRQQNANVSRNMERVVLKALAPDPGQRYADAGKMADDLEAFLLPELEKPKEVEEKPSLLARALPFLLSLLLLACIGVVVENIRRPHFQIPWLQGPPTPTPEPVTFVLPLTTTVPTITPTPLPSPTPTPTPLPTAIPVSAVILNQVRLDQFPQVIAYTSALNDQQEPFLGLRRENFRVRQDDAEIGEFQVDNVDAARDPLSMIVAIDISGSMKGEPLEKAKAAAANFVGRFDPGDGVSLVKFDDRIELVHDFTTDKEAVIQAIASLTSRGDTALYDVIAYSVERLGTQTGRRAVVVLTDGRDTASTQHGLDSSVATANGQSIPVFVVGLDSSQFTPRVMEQIASGTGGAYLYAPTPDELDALYQKIRGQLQNQYRVEFTSLHASDEAVHTLGIGLVLGEGDEMWSEKEYTLP